jgi:hypothetical protein
MKLAKNGFKFENYHICGYLWLFVVVCGCLWLFVVVLWLFCGCFVVVLWLFVVVCGCLWLFVVVCGCLWLFCGCFVVVLWFYGQRGISHMGL